MNSDLPYGYYAFNFTQFYPGFPAFRFCGASFRNVGLAVRIVGQTSVSPASERGKKCRQVCKSSSVLLVIQREVLWILLL